MRGEKASISNKEVDLVIVSVRYLPEAAKVEFVRGYARRGQVWSDIELIDRGDLVDAVKRGQIVMTGKSLPLAGDFEVYSPVRLGSEDQLIAGENAGSEGDNLGLPIL